MYYIYYYINYIIIILIVYIFKMIFFLSSPNGNRAPGLLPSIDRSPAGSLSPSL